MPKFFVDNSDILNDVIKIQGKDVNHIKNVLRADLNDEIQICNEISGTTYNCRIKEINKEYIYCKIENEIQNNVESNVKITIFQGLPKADKMELIIQKSVELGVYDITPVDMKRCIVKLDNKDKIKKIERWQKISEVAAKQCGRNIIPQINEVIDINNICEYMKNYDIILVAYEKEKEKTLKDELEKLDKNRELKIGVVIGPEGGLEEMDIQKLKENGAKIVTLGKRILRTETVSLNIVSIIMYELEM